MENIYKGLCEICGAGNVLRDEPMSSHTSYRIGGPAAFFVSPDSGEMIERVIELCRENETEYYVLGNGTNLLVSDEGFEGVVISMKKSFDGIKMENGIIYAGAGALLSKIASMALYAAMEGFEFAAGIPGTIGGAVVMNAGAYGGEIKDVLKSVLVLVPGEGETVMSAEELQLGYRTSIFKDKDWIVTGAAIQLNRGERNDIHAKMQELKNRRNEKQPVELPSAGSAFKRPEGHFAGKLIEDAGLKGFSVGGACVSEKHAGFFVNKGGASAKDVMQLYGHVAAVVKDKFGVELEPEVKFVGRFE